MVSAGKEEKDRLTTLSARLAKSLKAQIVFMKTQYEHDLLNGYGSIDLPFALSHKYPLAEKELGYQYFFPSDHCSLTRVVELLAASHGSHWTAMGDESG